MPLSAARDAREWRRSNQVVKSHEDEERPDASGAEEQGQLFPFYPEWVPISEELVAAMEELPLEAVAVCVWLSYRRWDAVEKAHSEGRALSVEEAASPLEEVARAVGMSETKAKATLEKMERRGVVHPTPSGWYLTRYVVSASEE